MDSPCRSHPYVTSWLHEWRRAERISVSRRILLKRTSGSGQISLKRSSGSRFGPTIEETSPEFDRGQMLLLTPLQRPQFPERPRPESEEKIWPRIWRPVGNCRWGRRWRWRWQRRLSGRFRVLELNVAQLVETQRWRLQRQTSNVNK